MHLASDCATITSMAQDDSQHGRQFLTAHQAEIEQTLEGVYAWNAETAKYGIIWVCLTQAIRWAFLIAAAVATIGGLYIAVAFGLETPWFLWIASAVPLGIGFAFLSLIASAVRKSHQTSMQLAAAQASMTAPPNGH